MAYRRYRRSSAPAGGWKAWHEGKAAAVSRTFGGIDSDVKAAFFALTRNGLTEVLQRYATRYGDGPSRYARQSYAEWKRGTKILSGETLYRILQVVPPSLPFQLRVELLRKLRHNLLRGRTISITILGVDDLPAIDRAASTLIAETTTRDLPVLVRERLEWLSMGDSLAAEELLSASDHLTAAEFARAHLAREMAHLESLYRSTEEIHHATHRIDIAGGRVEILFKRKRWWMSNPSNSDDKRQPASLIRADQTKNLLEYSLQRLQGPAGEALLETAQREALRLQVEAHERELRRSMSQIEMEDFLNQAIRTLRQVDQKMNRVTMRGEFEGATGKTEVNVQSRFCFVATAVYGSADAPEVVALRRFRDDKLVNHAFGRHVTTAYYRVGPHLARAIVRWPRLVILCRRVLSGFVRRLEASAIDRR